MIGWWLCAAADRWRLSGARRTIFAAGGTVLLLLAAVRSADLFAAAGLLLFAVAFLALAEDGADRLAVGARGHRVLPRALHAAALHLRPDEHLLQAVPRGLAALRGGGGRPRLPRPRAPRRLRAMARRAEGPLRRGRAPLALHDGDGGARGAHRHPPDEAGRSGGPDARRPAVSRPERARRVPRGHVAAPLDRGHAGRARGAGPLLPGLRPHLDADRPADGPRMGVPRAAARQPDRRDRAPARRGRGDLHEPERRRRRAAPAPLPRRIRLRRAARAQDLFARGPRQVRSDARTLPEGVRESGRADLSGRRGRRGGRARARARGAADPASRDGGGGRRAGRAADHLGGAGRPVGRPTRGCESRATPRSTRRGGSGSPTSATRACASSTRAEATSADGEGEATGPTT